MHWIRRHSRGRPPHPDILTPAEWRVLAEVREGCTNAEIAARTGLSFNTVKTHVASILAKTGVPDRRALAAWDGEPVAIEAAAPARSRGFAWPLLGWLGGGGAKVAAGGVAAVVFVGAVFAAFAMLADAGDDGAPSSGHALAGDFSLTAVVEWTAGSPQRLEPHVVRYEWAQGGPNEWRVVEDGVPAWSLAAGGARIEGVLDARSHLVVADGDEMIIFSAEAMEYLRDPIGDDDAREPSPARFGIGPVEEDSVDAFVERLAESTAVSRAGTAEVLGRATHVITYEALAQPVLGLGERDRQLATGRLYVDPDSMFVLRHDFEFIDSGASTRVEVTDLALDVAHPDPFTFSPPPGSRDTLAGEGCPLGRVERPAVAGEFFQLAEVPAFLLESDSVHGGSGPDCELRSLSRGYLGDISGEDQPYLAFEQTRRDGGAVPERLQGGAPVLVGVDDGYASSAGDVYRLVWSRDGIALLIESNALDADELLDLAVSVERME